MTSPNAAPSARAPAAVASPCVAVCRMNPATGLCEGCLRTLEEIAAWSGLSDEEKRAVLQRVAARRAMR
ncbi:MAG: DUF1289 domain-containing protein [Burkholderiaceae bacterium]|nr:DUF1289 domain-containing protein [Burkholderiaceae bacterium]